MCAASSKGFSLFNFPLVEIWWGNLISAKTFEINLVSIIRTDDFYTRAKNNGSLKSNRKFL